MSYRRKHGTHCDKDANHHKNNYLKETPRLASIICIERMEKHPRAPLVCPKVVHKVGPLHSGKKSSCIGCKFHIRAFNGDRKQENVPILNTHKILVITPWTI